MAKDGLKQKIDAGQVVMGSWLTIDSEIVAEIMSRMGFDWLTIDIEHSAIDMEMTQRLVRTVELNGCVPLVRVGENNANLIKRVMDTGAHGVIVPMVNTAQDAQRAIEAVKYPPVGKRGVGLARAQGYGLSFEKYRGGLARQSVVVAIIEHVDAVENLEKILSVDGIDATMIGPYDLSGSMGHPGDFDRKDVQALIKRYMNVCRKFNKPSGFHVVEPESVRLQKKIKEGCRFLAYGTDALFLARGVEGRFGRIK
ncbi:MAG: aldolase/citrate lyase family protein [Candidatus Omnitrophota bacterium]